MAEYEPSTYGDRIAEVYEEWLGDLADAELIEQTVTRPAELAGRGAALELAIGTSTREPGRLAQALR